MLQKWHSPSSPSKWWHLTLSEPRRRLEAMAEQRLFRELSDIGGDVVLSLLKIKNAEKV
jgi:hypothetical protein